MPEYPYRLQIAWQAGLVLAWLGCCSPWPLALNALLAVLAAGMAMVAMVWMTRRVRARRRTAAHTLRALDGVLRHLPVEVSRHMPLVLVTGDAQAMACALGDDEARVTESAIWVRSSSPSDVGHLTCAIQAWRDGQGPDAIALLVAAGESDTFSWAAAWRPFQAALNAADRAIGHPMPVCLAIYARTLEDGREACPWFGISGVGQLDAETPSALLAPWLQAYVRAAAPDDAQTRSHRVAVLDALTRWAGAALWPLLAAGRGSPGRVKAFGVTAVHGVSMPKAPFSRFVTQTTGLVQSAGLVQTPVDHVERPSHPLPDALLAGMPREPRRCGSLRALAHAAMGLAAFFALGAAASAWHNRVLSQRMADHVRIYESIPWMQEGAKAEALGNLKQDRDELEQYANAGVPMRLGFGLYRGARWMPEVRRLIASYQLPLLPPSTIELDSMALFGSGSAVLNPGSNRVLVSTVETIKAHAGTRVLIAGHTDSIGRPEANLILSEARAAAVRDWLIDASGLPPTLFAIEGYGDTRPKASNEVESGRAANRRVEITLVPDCRSSGGSRSTPGNLACS